MDRNSSDIISDSDSNCSGFSTLSQWQQHRSRSKKNITTLNVLCNLLEFKSCEIKSVKFESVNKFAIKLVPSGFLRNKKLYLLPDSEDCLTEWCGMITGFITKNINVSTLITRTDNRCSTLKSIKTDENINNITIANEIYISLDDNDAYETSNQNEFYLVNIKPSEDSIKLKLEGCYILKLDIEALELLSSANRELIHAFPYSSIRRFGAKDSMFKLEAGRHCSTGNGSFTFQVKDAAQLAGKVKENARRFKDRKSINNFSLTLSRPTSSLDRVMTEDMTLRSEKLDCDFQNDGSANTIVEEALPCVENCIDIVDGLKIDRVVCNEEIVESTDVREEVKERGDEYCINGEIESSNVAKLRCGNPIGNYEYSDSKSEEMINEAVQKNFSEIRPTSLFETSTSRHSLYSTEPLSTNPLKTEAPPVITEYKVSESKFFKYRQIQRPAVPVLSFLPDEDVTPDKEETNSVNMPSPKRSPPPLFPKPKLRTPDINYDQSGYREFDRMLQDLQLSMS